MGRNWDIFSWRIDAVIERLRILSTRWLRNGGGAYYGGGHGGYHENHFHGGGGYGHGGGGNRWGR